MPFATHLFISYAHIDNQPLSPEAKGWVCRFHVALEALLGMRLGRRPRVWRDRKLSGNDLFSDEISEQLKSSAVIASVLSDSYTASAWCKREVREFCEAAEAAGGLVIGNRCRVFKVIKTPVASQEALPAEIRGTLGYDFYVVEEDGTALELDSVYGEKYGQLFAQRVARLALHMAELLKKLEPDNDGGPANGGKAALNSLADARALSLGEARASVYLAECAADREEDRERLSAELTLRGYSVLPSEPLPRDEASYLTKVGELLERCALSVHLVGKLYGDAFGESGKSGAVIQNELAAERARTGHLRRLISVPADSSSKQPQQAEFIEQIHTNAEAQRGADVLTSDLEGIKTALQRALLSLTEAMPEALKLASEDQPRLIYLICVEQDRGELLPLLRALSAQGFEVRLPAFSGEAAAVRQSHEALLRDCDAALLFYGRGDEAWRNHQQNELRRAPALRARPLSARYTCLGAPLTEDKQLLLASGERNVIDAVAGFSTEALQSFVTLLDRIPSAKAAS